MPLDGTCAWKAPQLSVDERIDRFFNLIDHAVENGVPLKELYDRKCLKELIHFILENPNAKGSTH